MSRLIDLGACPPLGAHVMERGVSFALCSLNATRVELCLFDPQARVERARMTLPACEGGVWHGFLPHAQSGLVYGYRVHGPYAPHEGHRFNAHKLLLDPYARQLAGSFVWDESHYGYTCDGPDDASFDTRDNAQYTYKARVTSPFDMKKQASPIYAWRNTILYELHVRGFTMRLPGLNERERGRLSGLAQVDALKYMRALGVTTLELLPVHAFIDDARLVQQGLCNYWGYNTLNYFTPHPGYAGVDTPEAMGVFVDAAHDAGLEVVLDVVYNHTCETDQRGPTLSFRGVDNASYYRLQKNNRAWYEDITGCGATLNADSIVVQNLILDSLEHWVQCYGVDGFRFDLATQLGVSSNGAFSAGHALFRRISESRVLRNSKLIAEPWDAGGGFQLGAFPRGWAEWNARSRDAMRRFWRGDESIAQEFAQRMQGSKDLFEEQGRSVYSSVNYATCHDGFTARDLVSYRFKHNLANGEDNRDGSNHCLSVNHGVEGDTPDVQVVQRRAQHVRNLLTSAVMARGTPMLLAGDELWRTQRGNNNAYAQDNEVSWIEHDVCDGGVDGSARGGNGSPGLGVAVRALLWRLSSISASRCHAESVDLVQRARWARGRARAVAA
jgi:glycogen operon protein